MRYLLLCFMTATAVLVWACGADPVPNDGSGGACAPDDNVASACAGPVQCVIPEGTCTCDLVTDAGSLAFLCLAGELRGPDRPRGLPAMQPKSGDCCATEGMTCGGWDICAPICHCREGRWSCKDPDCPLFFCPDPVEELAGQRCDDRIGDHCVGSIKGCSDLCTCQLDYQLGGGVWQCTGPQCTFDGGVGEAGPPIDAGPFDAGPIDAGDPEAGSADGG